MTEKLTKQELKKDTLFLFPVEHSLDEITIWGKQTVNADSLRKNIPYLAPDHKAPHGVMEFDFAKMLDARKRRDMKQLKKLRSSFRKMDESEDPIVKAYQETLREKERQEAKKSSTK